MVTSRRLPSADRVCLPLRRLALALHGMVQRVLPAWVIGWPFRVLRRLLGAGLLGAVIALGVTAMAVVCEPMPELWSSLQYAAGLSVQDQAGHALGQVRGPDYSLGLPVTLRELPSHGRAAVVAAEDARFYRHRGVDPIAVGRALWQLVRQRRIVSGASTITQQLARSVVPRPRTLYGKWRELVVSLRIERELDKPAILEAYLNHVAFGPTTRGIGAAAEDYFGKPLQSMSVAEAAALAALPKGPTRYHPRRHEARLLARRNWVLEHMRALGFIDDATARLASLEPLRVRDSAGLGKAPHFVRALAQGRFGPASLRLGQAAVVETTLDRGLQQEMEKLLQDARSELERVGATAAALVVLDNAESNLLAYVGSIDFFDSASLGQNDGCLALRQPGSALKPFVYAAGIEWLRLQPTSLLADVETRFETPTGAFTPKNYDGRFHGPVLLREALGASLNVPAVLVTERVGVERLLSLLRGFGFRSLVEPAAHYGLAMALGDGEVRLIEVAEAYASLARHGAYLPLRAVRAVTERDGTRHEPPRAAAVQVISEATAIQILEILADDSSRAASFGRHGMLELPFAAAVKTGTSSNHRDNWAVAVTHEITVAVWVGNFNGRALAHGTSGVVGAAPLLRAAMVAAMRARREAPLFLAERLVLRRICKNSGQRPGSDCPNVVEIPVLRERSLDQECTIHRRVSVDPENGLLAGSGCRHGREQVVEVYPDALMEWARQAGRPIPPASGSPRCPEVAAPSNGGELTLLSPAPGTKYLLDPHLPQSQQRLKFNVRAEPRPNWVKYEVDGVSSGELHPPFHWFWTLQPGKHRVSATASNGAHDEATFSVE